MLTEAESKDRQKHDPGITPANLLQNLELPVKADAKRDGVCDNKIGSDDQLDSGLRGLSTFLMRYFQNMGKFESKYHLSHKRARKWYSDR